MFPLKQSTAIAFPFFAHDANGDGVTGIIDANFTKRISKGGGAFAAMTVTISEMENGWYSLSISTTHSNTLGVLSISISAAACKRVNLQFRVSGKLIDDLNDIAQTDIVSDSTAFPGASITEVRLAELDAGNLPADLTTITAYVDELETRLSAARAGYLDELNIGAETLAHTGNAASFKATGFSTHDAAAVKTAIEAAGSSLALIKAVTDALTASAAAKLAASAGTILEGTAETGTLSTTQMTTDLVFTDAEQLKGRIIIFKLDTTTAGLRWQATDITDAVVVNGLLTFTAITTAPSNGDTFVIV